MSNNGRIDMFDFHEWNDHGYAGYPEGSTVRLERIYERHLLYQWADRFPRERRLLRPGKQSYPYGNTDPGYRDIEAGGHWHG